MHAIVCPFPREQVMTRRGAIMAFLRSREGSGLIGIVFFAAALSVVAGYGFYQASLHAFVEHKTDEKATALQLVDAFVSNYSNLRKTPNGRRFRQPFEPTRLRCS